jgi:hypothetical protein
MEPRAVTRTPIAASREASGTHLGGGVLRIQTVANRHGSGRFQSCASISIRGRRTTASAGAATSETPPRTSRPIRTPCTTSSTTQTLQPAGDVARASQTWRHDLERRATRRSRADPRAAQPPTISTARLTPGPSATQYVRAVEDDEAWRAAYPSLERLSALRTNNGTRTFASTPTSGERLRRPTRSRRRAGRSRSASPAFAAPRASHSPRCRPSLPAFHPRSSTSSPRRASPAVPLPTGFEIARQTTCIDRPPIHPPRLEYDTRTATEASPRRQALPFCCHVHRLVAS